jgi:hypothetical protein
LIGCEARTRTPSDVDDLAVLTPSFRGDVSLFADLHDSVLANTPPSVMHHVVVPPSDARLFRQFEGPRCRIWTHRDLLPRYCLSVPYASGLTLSLRRPWLPVRGWVTQQIMKMAGTAAIDARVVLIIDSDAVLLREPTLDEFAHNGRLWHFRRERAVTAGMDRHLLWHNVARKLLGLEGIVAAPAPDYISPITIWDPAVVRSLMEHIADTTGRDWMDAVTGELHVSEFVLYGVFVDSILGGIAPFAGPLCHNYYERIPLSPADARAFAEQMPPNALGAMISSHSHTPSDVRQEAFQQCGEIADGRFRRRAPDRGAPNSIESARDRRASNFKARLTNGLPWGDHRCLGAAMVIVHLSAIMPVV